MDEDKKYFDRHVSLFNKIATATYDVLNKEELSEEDKYDVEIAHTTVITVLRFAAKLAVEIGMEEEDFSSDASEMFYLENGDDVDYEEEEMLN